MSRLIDADYLLRKIPSRKLNGSQYAQGFIDAVVGVKDLLNSIPTVDAVPVVRCKDCAYWVDYDTCQNSGEAKNKYCALLSLSTSAGFYCGLAERKTDDSH